MSCQIVNFEIKKVKPVKIVNTNINAANCDVFSDAVRTLFAQFTQPKYRNFVNK